MAARLSAFVIWSLVAGSFAFWALRLFVPSTAAPSYAVGVGEAAAPRGDLTRLLGPDAGAPAVVQPAAASRFALSGVLAPKEGFANSHGVALIAVDGRPARAYQVGARLVDDMLLVSVTRRTASLGTSPSAASIVLELPERPAPATGTLPAYNGGEMGSPAPRYSQQPPRQAVPTAPPAQPEFQQQPPQPEPQPVPEASPPDSSGSPGPQMGQGPPRRGAPESR
ncbi:hypothetical protein BH09PSE5_BH09PSE5_29840 [soil metagenome]